MNITAMYGEAAKLHGEARTIHLMCMDIETQKLKTMVSTSASKYLKKLDYRSISIHDGIFIYEYINRVDLVLRKFGFKFLREEHGGLPTKVLIALVGAMGGVVGKSAKKPECLMALIDALESAKTRFPSLFKKVD